MLLINPYRFSAPRFISNDADVAAYVLTVEAADGQQLESGVISAYDSFITGCKSDGIWSAIKASCILAGARTLSGALVPLVGTAPTNSNFVSGDYSRTTGLLGNGSTKNLNTNRAANAEPQDNIHQGLYLTQAPTINITRFVSGSSTAPQTYFSSSTSGVLGSRCRTSSTYLYGSTLTAGFKGQTRSIAASYVVRSGQSSVTRATASSGNPGSNYFVFSAGTAGSFDGRISYYSIGESLDLALLDSRVSTLMTALAAALP